MTRMHDNGMWSIQTTLPGFLEYIFSGEPLLYGWLVPTAIHCLIAKSLKRVLPVSNRRLASQTNLTWSGQLRLGASSERQNGLYPYIPHNGQENAQLPQQLCNEIKNAKYDNKISKKKTTTTSGSYLKIICYHNRKKSMDVTMKI